MLCCVVCPCRLAAVNSPDWFAQVQSFLLLLFWAGPSGISLETSKHVCVTDGEALKCVLAREGPHTHLKCPKKF